MRFPRLKLRSLGSAGRFVRAAHGLAGGLAILIALTAIGCSIELDAVGPRTPVASIDITPTAVVLEVGQSRLLTAVTKDAQGHVLEGRDIDWSADDANVAVSSSGVVVGQKPGSAVVHASCEGKSFGVAVTVVLGASSSYDLLYRRRWDDERSDISVLSFGTGGAPAVVMAGLASSHPTASPTGERIAFAVAEYDVFSNDGGLVYSIYAVDRDGANARRLTQGSGSEDQRAWSPDGEAIAFAKPGFSVVNAVHDSSQRHPASAPHARCLVGRRRRAGLDQKTLTS